MMKKLCRMRIILMVAMLLGGIAFLSGCGDPEKPAGPGGERTQPYDSAGKYK